MENKINPANNLLLSITKNIKKFSLIYSLFLILIIFAIITGDNFLAPRNLSNLFRQMTILAFMSIGVTFILISGNIDLSIGLVAIFASVFSVALQTVVFTPNLPVWFPSLNNLIIVFGIHTTINGILSTLFSFLVCMLFGIIFGIYQGALIAYCGIPSLIATWGNSLILTTLAYLASMGSSLVITENFFIYLGQGYTSKRFGVIIAIITIIIISISIIINRNFKIKYRIKHPPLYSDLIKIILISIAVIIYVIYIANGYLGFQVPVLILIVLAVSFHYILSYTKFGTYCYAIGSNKESALLSGINVRKNLMLAFVTSGFLGSVSGFIASGYMGGLNTGVQELTFPAFIACMIGLISFKDRKLIIPGVIIGAIILESIDNFGVFFDLPPYIKYIVKGLILIVVFYMAKLKKLDISNIISNSLPPVSLGEITSNLKIKIKSIFGEDYETHSPSPTSKPPIKTIFKEEYVIHDRSLESSKAFSNFIIWGGIILFASILYISGITHESLWCDEAFSANMTDYGFLEIIQKTTLDVHPPLYYLLLKIVRFIFGNSEWALRIPSITGAMGLILLGPGPVKRLFGNRTSYIYAFIILFTPIVLIMSHEVRMYSLSMFMVTSCALYGLLATSENKTRYWIIFGLSSVMAAYLHYFGLITVFYINLFLFVRILVKDRKLIKNFIITAGAAVISYMPWLLFLFRQINKVKNDFWISPVDPLIILQSFLQAFYYKNFFPVEGFVYFTAFLIFLMIVLIIIVSLIRICIRYNEELFISLFLFSCFMFTLLTAIAASYMIRPVLYPRYMTVCTGLLILPFCVGLNFIKIRKFRYFIIISFILLNLHTIFNVITKEFNGSFSQIKKNLSGKIKPGELMITSDCYCISPAIYYFPEAKHYFYVNDVEKNWDFTFDAMKQHLIDEPKIDNVLEKYDSFWVIKSSYTGNFGLSIDTSEILKDNPGWKRDGEPINFENDYSLVKFSISKYIQTGKKDTVKTSGKMVINIKNIKKASGKLWISLFDKSPVGDPGKAYKSGIVGVNAKEMIYTFYDVPYGEYALIVIHDINNNSRFDISQSGMIKDGLGFYNYTLNYGYTPTFYEMKFNFTGEQKELSVEIKYQ